MSPELIGVVAIIAVALVFDFTNGFHDAANSIATIVSTRVLTPRQAVVWAAVFNFIAFLVFGTTVAKTIGKGLIEIEQVNQLVIFAGLIGTIGWNILTWWIGLPTSSSHALIGGYAGAAIAKAGFGVIIAAGWTKTLVFIVLAPSIGLILGLILMTLLSWLVARRPPRQVNLWFRRLQLISAALYSLGHGGNDAQKTMGIIASLLVSSGYLQDFAVPLWVVLAAHGAIALGTLAGGWRIVKTMGTRIVKLTPVGGFAAETGSAASLFLATHLGAPVSTTHVITGAISGVGAAARISAVRWGVTLRIVWAWLLTIPCAGLMAFLTYEILRLLIAAF
ncbi:inorganic phosphate transporter [Candidatus Berkelbacteria bacterium]|nr:inorganic phosphate transporter [Candidatus Berkelbacteria bacterium]